MITNYDELRAEQKRLKDFLAIKKEHIRTDIEEIKEEFRPALAVAKIISAKSVVKFEFSCQVARTRISKKLYVTRGRPRNTLPQKNREQSIFKKEKRLKTWNGGCSEPVTSNIFNNL
jgi:hypothetical protein